VRKLRNDTKGRALKSTAKKRSFWFGHV